MIDDQTYNVFTIFYNKSNEWINNNVKFKYNKLIKNKQILKIFDDNKNNKTYDAEHLSIVYKLVKASYITYDNLLNMKSFGYIIPNFNDIYVKYFLNLNLKKKQLLISIRGTKHFNEFLLSIKFYRINFEIFKEKKKENGNDDFIKWRNKYMKNNYFDKTTIPLLEDEDIQVHKGFYDEALKQYNTLVPTITFILEKVNTLDINIMGHSLGGSLGIIISLLLAKKFKEKINIYIYTFNSPPIGNKNFNLLIPYFKIKRFTRIFNNQDFIARYGENGSWIDKKRFRHFEYLLNKKKGTIYLKDLDLIIDTLDYGNILNEKIKDLKCSLFDLKYIFHSFFTFSKKNKILYV